ncbi:MAG: hypothetical protein COB36_01920 [Alphaproteobacteria bacterium]|nr:MAG: hypothetical protein COB36_01920 [Alphaproteobacteria bacterium]
MTNDFKKNTGSQTKQSVLGLIADYVRDSEEETIPITSCHSAVAYWIVDEDILEPSDEIVLLGPDIDNDLVYHSILMRDGDIIGDTERVAPRRQIDTTYDMETGAYNTKMSNSNPEAIVYHTLERISLAEFRNQYLNENKQDVDVKNAGTDLDSGFNF